jgi:hypothetical protein
METATEEITAVLYRSLAVAELKAPESAAGAFIPAGNAFDAFAALGKVLGGAQRDLLVIDPYMDEKILTDFGALPAEPVTLRLLADEATHKAGLPPAAQAWTKQHIGVRPVALRLAPPRTLHDRLIIADSADAWVLTQSFNAFATRAPASIVRVDPETAALKVSAYEAIWSAAKVLV